MKFLRNFLSAFIRRAIGGPRPLLKATLATPSDPKSPIPHFFHEPFIHLFTISVRYLQT